MATTTDTIVPLTVMICVDGDELCEIEAGVEITLHRKETARSGYDAGSGAEYTIENCLVNCRKYHNPSKRPLGGHWTENWHPAPAAFVPYIKSFAESEAGRRDVEGFIREEM